TCRIIGWRPALLHACFDLMDQLLHGFVNDLLAGAAEPLVTDYTLVVDEVNRRGAGQDPLLGDDAASLARRRIAERSPGKVLLVRELLEGRGVRFTDVDTDDCERLVGEILHERPLVRPQGPSGASVLVPEVEQHDLAPVVAQLELVAVLILPFDIGRHL